LDDQKNHGKDWKKDMQTAGFKYSLKKMESAAESKAGSKKVTCNLCCVESDKT